MISAEPARINLLPAKKSPYVIIIRRKPSKCFHIIRWNTKTDKLEYGSWFNGKIYSKRCDVSFDGQWMVYLAMGSTGETWNGICNPPFLRAVVEGENMGSWFGGGFWSDPKALLLNQWNIESGSVPFKTKMMSPEYGGECLSVLYAKWQRDGWQRCGGNYGTEIEIPNTTKLSVECQDDDGWKIRPTKKHPFLKVRCIGYLKHGYTFRYSLEKYELVDEEVDSACWDSLGNLIFSRRGVLYKYTLADIKNGQSGMVIDLEPLKKPE